MLFSLWRIVKWQRKTTALEVAPVPLQPEVRDETFIITARNTVNGLLYVLCGSSHLFVVCMSSSVRFVHVWIFTLIQRQRLFEQVFMVLWNSICSVIGLIVQVAVLWFWSNLCVLGKKCWSSRFFIQILQEILCKNFMSFANVLGKKQ